MFKILGKLPRDCYIALSGGQDSMALLHFLKCVPQRKITALYFNHGTDHGTKAQRFVTSQCAWYEVPLHVEAIEPHYIYDSVEAYWRDQRYKFFAQFTDKPIVMAHHLDDCLETWLWTSFHGKPSPIPYRRDNIIRPLLLTRKEAIQQYCKKYGLIKWIEDPSNQDLARPRNFIRHNIVPQVSQVHPGIYKEISKVVMKKESI